MAARKRRIGGWLAAVVIMTSAAVSARLGYISYMARKTNQKDED